MIDHAALAQHVQRSLAQRAQISLSELLALRPLQHGLAELVAYLQLASDQANAVIDADTLDTVVWQARDGHSRRATLPRVTFSR